MKTRHLLFMAATAVTLAACSGDEHESGAPTDAEGNLIAARFSAGIGEAVPVRASDTSWATDGTDKIGISAASGNTAMAEKYQNVKYTVNSDGALTGETIYFQNMDEVTFNAYYPYTDTDNMTNGVISHTITASDQTSSNQPTIDYLFASETTKYASPTIDLQFGHRMSKIVVKFENGNGVEQSEVDGISSYTISGLKLAGEFDTATGEAAATGSASALTITKGTEDDAELQTSLIVYPQEAASFTLSLSMGGSNYQCSLAVADGKLEAGNSYTYKITVNKTGLTSATTISGWDGESDTPTEGTAEILYGIDTKTHTITTYKAGVITADLITKAMGDEGTLNVVGLINNADLKAIVGQNTSYTTLDLSEAKKGTDEEELTLENRAFKDCTSLTSISLPEGLTTLGGYAFSGCKALTEVTLPDGLTTIGYSAFEGCTSLTSISLPEGLTTLGNYAFRECTKLTSISLPDGLTTIGNSAFYQCTSLTSITLPDGLTTIGNRAFYECSLTSITLPNGLTTIGEQAFMECTKLTSISLPDGLTTIGEEAFSCCDVLTSITIPASVTSIGDQFVYACDKMTKITCRATTPPECDGDAFKQMLDSNYASNLKLYVPAGCVDKYKETDGWKVFKEYYGGIYAISE